MDDGRSRQRRSLADPVVRLGQIVADSMVAMGDLTVFGGSTLLWMVRRRTRWSTLAPCLYEVGVRSVPVVAITGMFIGMVLAVQAHSQFKSMGMESRLGSIVNISLVKELGPVLAATMLAGRVGSAIAAELGTMRVTEQIDALKGLGVNPIHYLVVPRFLACFFLIPLLTIFADFMGALGGAFVSINLLGVDRYYYWLYSQSYVGALDLLAGIFKSYFFGAAIALISCHRGFHSGAGAEGVGEAATQSFVFSFIAILFLDFVIGMAWNSVYYAIWPETSAGLL